MACAMKKQVEVNPVTGLIDRTIFLDEMVENQHNNCRYFKKRFFAKKRDIKYCKDCIHFMNTSGDW